MATTIKRPLRWMHGHETIGDMEAAIIHTLRYFAHFSYAPTLDEIHIFLSEKTSRADLEDRVKKMDGIVSSRGRYVLAEHAQDIKGTVKKASFSKAKVLRIQRYIHIISWFPQIQLVGLSGSVAMQNAEEDDDIDLFVITARRRMWTARLICYVVSSLLGIRRHRGSVQVRDRVCHNLFFDEGDLSLPPHKRREYGAHEVLQMKPLSSVHRTYERFLAANAWAYAFFPNAQPLALPANSHHPVQDSRSNPLIRSLFDMLELAAKFIQTTIIRRHTTTERITDTQLWFFPDDYEAKL